jgi:catechol 2,3-dioxygenase-like lactoylglutathione lyase family enzyme
MAFYAALGHEVVDETEEYVDEARSCGEGWLIGVEDGGVEAVFQGVAPGVEFPGERDGAAGFRAVDAGGFGAGLRGAGRRCVREDL